MSTTTSWSDSELRHYVLREAEGRWSYGDGEAELKELRARFVTEVRSRIVPTVQERLLATVGTRGDPEGISLVIADLVRDIDYHDADRRWLVATVDPWGYLGDWSFRELRSAYGRAVGKADREDRVLRRLASDRKRN